MNKNYKLINILVALFFAAIILTVGYFMQGLEDKSTVIMLVIAIWFIPFNYINKRSKANSCK